MIEYDLLNMRFSECLDRARDLSNLQHYLSREISQALNTNDMLRASVVLSVSAYDFMAHELYRIKALERYKNNLPIDRLSIPYNIFIENEADIESKITTYITEQNSYKSFVDPAKFSETMSCFTSIPWDQISFDLSSNAKDIKQRVRTIYKWCNRIAHEADINPTLSGIELWPIIKDDVINAINDLDRIGTSAIKIIRNC